MRHRTRLSGRLRLRRVYIGVDLLLRKALVSMIYVGVRGRPVRDSAVGQLPFFVSACQPAVLFHNDKTFCIPVEEPMDTARPKHIMRESPSGGGERESGADVVSVTASASPNFGEPLRRGCRRDATCLAAAPGSNKHHPIMRILGANIGPWPFYRNKNICNPMVAMYDAAQRQNDP